MDPNAALRDLRAALTEARAAADGDSNDAEIEAWQNVGDEIEILDEWLSKGGFLPGEWTRDTVTVRGVNVTAYSRYDTVSVQIETEGANEGQRLRVMLNDHDLYAGDPEVDE